MIKELSELPRNIAVAVAAFLLFVGSFKVNQLLDGYFLYGAGVSLLFIPAGVKLLCILLGGLPALIGLYFAGVYVAAILWSNMPTVSRMMLALIAVCFYGVAVYWVTHLLKIKSDLSNLKYWHIIVLSATTSLAHGWGLATAYISQDIATFQNVVPETLAIALGDFLGCFVVVMLFNFTIGLIKKVRARATLGNEFY
jgi:hypothetical protein